MPGVQIRILVFSENTIMCPHGSGNNSAREAIEIPFRTQVGVYVSWASRVRRSRTHAHQTSVSDRHTYPHTLRQIDLELPFRNANPIISEPNTVLHSLPRSVWKIIYTWMPPSTSATTSLSLHSTSAYAIKTKRQKSQSLRQRGS